MTFGNNGEAKYDHLPLEVGSDKLLTFAFPSYISPDYKDDMVIIRAFNFMIIHFIYDFNSW